MTEHEKATPRPVALNDIPEDLQIEYMCGFLCDDYVYRVKRELIERIARQQQSYDASRARIEELTQQLASAQSGSTLPHVVIYLAQRLAEAEEQVEGWRNGSQMAQEEYEELCGELNVAPSSCCKNYCANATFQELKKRAETLDASRALIEQMRGALVAIEFCVGGFCPVCRGGRKSRHGASCDIGQLLAAAEKFLEDR